MQTTDTDLLFHSSAQLHADEIHKRKSRAAASVGDPILIRGKPLDFIVRGDVAYIAESGWQARILCLKTRKTLGLYKGHTGPVTAIAICDLPAQQRSIILTASWDKSIICWDAMSSRRLCSVSAHADFVKSLLILPGRLLLSTSSDRTLRLWDLAPLEKDEEPVEIQNIRYHTRPVHCAAVLGETIWTGDSMGILCEWRLAGRQLVHVREIHEHETSIVSMAVCEWGVWTASMDKSVILHPFGAAQAHSRIKLEHPCYVTAVLPLPSTIDNRDLVLTGGDDEMIRVWDGSEMISQVEGHCGPISALRLWSGDSEPTILSSSLDGTIRKWSMRSLLYPELLVYHENERGEPSEKGSVAQLTEDEERELAELMES